MRKYISALFAETIGDEIVKIQLRLQIPSCKSSHQLIEALTQPGLVGLRVSRSLFRSCFLGLGHGAATHDWLRW